MKIRVKTAGCLALASSIFLVLAASPASAATAVSIQNFAFNPQTVTVSAGTTVTWTNQQSGVSHSVTSDSGAFDSSPSNCSPSVMTGCIPTGGTFSFTFNTAGTFGYHCRVHTFMTGTITVQAVTTTTAAPPSTTAPPTTAPGVTTTTVAPSSSSTTAPANVAGAVATTTTLPTTGAAGTGRLAAGAGLLTLTGLLLVGAARRRPRRQRR